MAHNKRLKSGYASFDRAASFDLAKAVEMVKANARAKFDETVEISMNLGIDPRHADQMVRGVVGLPNGTGKTVRIAVFARGAKCQVCAEVGFARKPTATSACSAANPLSKVTSLPPWCRANAAR